MNWLKNCWEAIKKEYRFHQLPWTCRHCEVFGLCRDEHNNWKCKHGCLVLNAERKKGAEI